MIFKIEEYVVVETSGKGDVIVKLPYMSGQIVFSPAQACELAGNLIDKSRDALRENDGNPPNTGG